MNYLYHTTEYENFDKILDEKRLNTNSCPVFDKELLYLFYGRPAYMQLTSSAQLNVLEHLHKMPVTLQFNLNDIKQLDVYKIFPFDSGALKNNLLGSLKFSDKEYYNLEQLKQMNPFIEYFYEDFDTYIYFAEEVKEESEIDFQGLVRFLNNGSTIDHWNDYHEVIADLENQYDARGRVIEVLLQNSISISLVYKFFIDYRSYKRYHANNDASYLYKHKDKVKTFTTFETGRLPEWYGAMRHVVLDDSRPFDDPLFSLVGFTKSKFRGASFCFPIFEKETKHYLLMNNKTNEYKKNNKFLEVEISNDDQYILSDISGYVINIEKQVKDIISFKITNTLFLIGDKNSVFKGIVASIGTIRNDIAIYDEIIEFAHNNLKMEYHKIISILKLQIEWYVNKSEKDIHNIDTISSKEISSYHADPNVGYIIDIGKGMYTIDEHIEMLACRRIRHKNYFVLEIDRCEKFIEYVRSRQEEGFYDK